MPSSRSPSSGASLRCPAVTRTERGRARPSQARCTLVENPPYCAPTPRRARPAAPFSSPRPELLACAGGVLVRAPPSCLRSPPTRSSRPRSTCSARGSAGAPRCRRAASARTDRSRSARGRSAWAGPSTAPQSSASTGCRLSPCGARASAHRARDPPAVLHGDVEGYRGTMERLGRAVMRWTHVLDEYFRHRAAQDLFSGAVLITQSATQLYARAYGYASRAWGVPNTLDTRFDTASVTKLFTAIATLQLIDRGMLAFDTPVVERLGLEGTPLSKDVTVFHLLTHTSGIGDDADEEAGGPYPKPWEKKGKHSALR